MGPDPPAITVCVPTYNRARYLPQALESIAAQTHAGWEAVVYDDASTDDTAEVIGSFRDDARFRFFRQPRNVGIAANRNACLREARGDYIAWLDSDDVYEPEMLATQAAVLDRRPGVGLVHGAFRSRRTPSSPGPGRSPSSRSRTTSPLPPRWSGGPATSGPGRIRKGGEPRAARTGRCGCESR
jgi:glycosyltransferase involved in cell wall biosynthesis